LSDVGLPGLLSHALQDGTLVDLTDWDPATAYNQFAGHTVYSIPLQKFPPPNCPPVPITIRHFLVKLARQMAWKG
jgi:hypothetical protein